MKINEIENKYVVKVCTKKSSAQYAHIYENISDITQLFPKSRLFSLRDGLSYIIKHDLKIYLFDGLRDKEVDSAIKEYLLANGLSENNIR